MGGIYWLASYPKSGNTWLRSFLSNLLSASERAVSINELSEGFIASSRIWLDDLLGFDTADLRADEVERLRPDAYDWAGRGQVVHFCKIHDAFSTTRDGLPLVGTRGTRGAIYIIRNPLDVVPSAADHWRCDLDHAIHRMGLPTDGLALAGQALKSQVTQRLGTWSGHVLSWVDAPGLQCQVMRYEDMLSQPQATFLQAVRFMQLAHSAEQVERALRFSDFQVLAQQEAQRGFKERPAGAQRFFRQGRSGAWRDVLSPAQVRRVVDDHGAVMRRFGYLDGEGRPL